MPPRIWLWAIIFIGVGIIIWWKVEAGEINEMKSELLGRQKAVVAELGPRWFPLQEKIDRWTAECGADNFQELPADDLAATWNFREMPGIYLRVGQSDTTSVENIRKAARKSLRDGFTSCLFVVDNPSPLSGKECITTQECPRGQMCNEFNHCAQHSQPFNLRLAYKTLHMLSDEWVAEVQDISNKLTMRGAIASFDSANEYDLPVAAELLVNSKYFLVVVDEPVDADEGDLANALPSVEDAGVQDDRSIPTAPHPARVCVWRLEDDKKMLAIRRDASAVLRGPDTPGLSMETAIAKQRQANSCALALAVREAIGAQAGAVVPDDDTDGTGGSDGAGGGAGDEDAAGNGGGSDPSDAGAGGNGAPKGG